MWRGVNGLVVDGLDGNWGLFIKRPFFVLTFSICFTGAGSHAIARLEVMTEGPSDNFSALLLCGPIPYPKSIFCSHIHRHRPGVGGEKGGATPGHWWTGSHAVLSTVL